MRSIQLGPILTWGMQIIFPLILEGLHKSSTRITQGKFCVEEVASVAKELAWVFPLLGMCCRLNDSNFSCRCLIIVKYPALSRPLPLIRPSLDRRLTLSPRTL